MKMSSGSSSEERPTVTTQLVFPNLLKPILIKLQKTQPQVAKTIHLAISKAEQSSPGVLLELVIAILRKNDPRASINMTESLLRLQGLNPEFDDQRIRRPEEPFQELNKKCFSLRKILSRIPDEIHIRSTFLETIKEIASAIKKLLDCVNEIQVSLVPSTSDRSAIEGRKREFIKYSKKFSTTLKDFFKEGEAQSVYVAAAHLLHQTNTLQFVIKNRCVAR